MTLDQLQFNLPATIHHLHHSDQRWVQQMNALGLLPGEQVVVLRTAPLGDPMQIKVGGTLLSIRKYDAQLISLQSLGA